MSYQWVAVDIYDTDDLDQLEDYKDGFSDQPIAKKITLGTEWWLLLACAGMV
jgi:hypothetical protein